MKRGCPTCGQVAERSSKLFPFCSDRCQLVDLGRWLSEEYRIADEADRKGGGAESVMPSLEEE
jgi:endogenous inhibitor of DNA gyrase (YacG/DUF329 family)